MKCLRIKPGWSPEIVEIECELKSLQAEVGGYIEAVYPFDDEVALICNEEGKILGLPPNRALTATKEDGKEFVYDIVCGTFLVTGLGEEDFDSLSDELLEKYANMFAIPETFDLNEHGEVVVHKNEA